MYYDAYEIREILLKNLKKKYEFTYFAGGEYSDLYSLCFLINEFRVLIKIKKYIYSVDNIENDINLIFEKIEKYFYSAKKDIESHFSCYECTF